MRWVWLLVCLVCLASAMQIRGITPTNADDALFYPLVAVVLTIAAAIFGLLFLSKQWPPPKQ